VLRRETLPPATDQRCRHFIEKHFDGIIAWHKNHLSNGLLEGINSLVQAAKARAQGYRSKTKMITIVYLTAAKLQLPSLTNPTPAYMSSR
jgi:Transposase